MRDQSMVATAILILCLSVSGDWRAGRPGQPVSPALQEFLAQVRAYCALRDEIRKELGKLDEEAEPEEIESWQNQLTVRLREARSGAVQGQFFTPQASRELVRIVEEELAGPLGQEVREAISAEDPQIRLEVNVLYPEHASLATVPPTLLMRLPRLPEKLQYRFSNWHLLLLDIEAHLILDYVGEQPSNGRRPQPRKDKSRNPNRGGR